MVRTRSTSEAFQTFLNADRSRWVVDPALKRNLVQVLQDLDIQLSPGEKNRGIEMHLFRHFLSQLSHRQDKLSHNHLQAFCEESRLKAVQRYRYRDLTNPQESDDFLRSISFDAVGVLTKDPERLSRSLKQYLNRNELNSSLSDYIATDLLGEIKCIYSDKFGQGSKSVWYQLKRISEKQLREKLRILGVLESDLSGYCRVRKWLYLVFTNPDSKRRWPDPTAEQYKKATQLYNSNESGTRISVAVFSKRIDLCVRAIVHKFSFEEVNEEIVGASTESSLLAQILKEEEEQHQGEDATMLDESIGFLHRWLLELHLVDPPLYEIALKRYGRGMSQQAIAKAVGLTRDRVRTRCSRIFRQSLRALQTFEPARTLIAKYGSSSPERAWEKAIEQLLPISARRLL
ncbi:MAG: hypothetical protein AAFY11_03745 [Cyanobacteria bacterium J06641_5]